MSALDCLVGAFMGTKAECEDYVARRLADPNEGDDW